MHSPRGHRYRRPSQSLRPQSRTFADQGWVGGGRYRRLHEPRTALPQVSRRLPRVPLDSAAPRLHQAVLLRFWASMNGLKRCPDQQLCRQLLTRHAAVVPVRSGLSDTDMPELGLPRTRGHLAMGFWALDPPVLQGGLGSGTSGPASWCSCRRLSLGDHV